MSSPPPTPPLTPARPPVHGPASVVGVALGLVCAATSYLVPDLEAAGFRALLVGPPLLGLVLLTWSGLPRQLGIGLLASGLAYPFGVAVVFGLIIALG